MIKLKDYATRNILAEIKAKDLNKWCDENGYLPHHKVGKSTWIVIK
jgi:hypothetical protein